MSFTHLQVRSGYSFFESTMTIDKLVNRAKQLHYDALALTDKEVLFGAIPFYQTCVQYGIKPIIGMIVNISVEEENVPLVLLAKNNDGYKALMQISTYIQLENSLSLTFLQEKTADLIGILSTETPTLKRAFIANDVSNVSKFLEPYRDTFPPANFYLGVESYGLESHSLLQAVKQYVTSENIRVTALHDVRYLEEKDVVSFECLQKMKMNETWDGRSIREVHKERHLRSIGEMEEAFSVWTEILQESTSIAEACNVQLSFGEHLLPKFPVPNGKEAHVYLRELCERNLELLQLEKTNRLLQRLDEELTIIERLGFSDYFLIVQDFVQFAKKNDILVGPGRGSAAGSLVSFLLGITNVNPLEHDLLFERFLNPERVTLPDIDIDFSDVRRDEVIAYVRDKYGKEHVAQIVTFGTFAARSLLRELMKTLDIDRHDQAYILRHVPVQATESVVHYVKQNKEFNEYVKKSPTLRLLFLIAVTLEGLPRHHSTHAAGIVIGKDPLIETVPLMEGTNETYLTQYAMNELEAIGLLKIDILGLRNLTLIERIVQTIEHYTKRKIELDQIPLNDNKTFSLLQRGKTNGVFQLESAGMKRVLQQLLPNSLDDIVALNALYRPGPMEQIPMYIARKHRREKVTYLHPDLRPILENTYGVLIYQEQIMQIVHQFAGLSYGQADILRRAISKKNRALIEEQRSAFVDGCVKKGYEKYVAEQIFSLIEKFADYGFNKSHSVAYSIIAYQLSYLKANYPTYFFAHLLGTATNDAQKLSMYVKEANELGIDILPPSINKSYAYFTVEGNNLRVGLMAIKGIGYETVQQILKERKRGEFTDLFHFCLRVTLKRNALETLILAGAFDETYDNRASLLASIDQALDRKELFGEINGQANLFSNDIAMKPAYVKMKDFSPLERLAHEKELLQMYVTSHPFKQYRAALALNKFKTMQQAKLLQEKNIVKLVAIIEAVRKIRTKRGESMAFVTLSDETDEIDGVVFPAVFRDIGHWLKEELIVRIEARVSIRNNEKQLIIERMQQTKLEKLASVAERYVYVKVSEQNETDAYTFLQTVSEQFPGDVTIILYNEREKKTYKLSEKYNIDVSTTSLDTLKRFFGSDSVVYRSR